MDTSEQTSPHGEHTAASDEGTPSPLMLRFTPDYVGALSIAAGLKCLADGKSEIETWVIARQASHRQPQKVVAHCTVARLVLGGPVSLRYSSATAPLGRESPAVLPLQGPQDIESACALLSAHLCGLAHRHAADVFRLEFPPPTPIPAPPTQATPERIWYRFERQRFVGTPVTTRFLRERLCAEDDLPPDAADRRLEAHAQGCGLLIVGEHSYVSGNRYALPLLSPEDYERVLRVLRLHIESCRSDRTRYGQEGHAGAREALACEQAASHRTLAFIESQACEVNRRFCSN